MESKFLAKRVLLRADFNVPIDNGRITDLTRITATIPTIKKVLEARPKFLLLASHLGRPDGKRVPKYSLAPVAQELQTLLGQPVSFVDDCVGQKVVDACSKLQNGGILLLENLRFYAQEEANDAEFSKQLSSLCDVYVNDAFGCCHRAHASIVGVNVPLRMAGLLVEKELSYFARVLEAPKPPVVMILGGAKVKDKIKLIKSMLKRVNRIVIGGAMALTFLKVLKNMDIGASLFDAEGAASVNDIMAEAKKLGVDISLPIDFVCGDSTTAESHTKTVSVEQGVPHEAEGSEKKWMALDIGPESVKKFAETALVGANTVVWNGPMGMFEVDKFCAGSFGLLDAVIKSKATAIVGGGDTAALVEKAGKEKASKLAHISTGGGASLELLEGRDLPGIVALPSRQEVSKV